MSVDNKNEVWLRGKISGIPDLLQPAAHTLLQVREDLHRYTADFPDSLLWEKPAGRASVGFHLNHLTGVLDRMLTYAADRELSEEQFEFLKKEGNPNNPHGVHELVTAFDAKVDRAIEIFKSINPQSLTAPRSVGREKLPSSVIGLLFHAAEHSSRHVGQLLVSISVLKEHYNASPPLR